MFAESLSSILAKSLVGWWISWAIDEHLSQVWVNLFKFLVRNLQAKNPWRFYSPKQVTVKLLTTYELAEINFEKFRNLL